MEIIRKKVSRFGTDYIKLFLYRAYFELDRNDEILFKVLNKENHHRSFREPLKILNQIRRNLAD